MALASGVSVTVASATQSDHISLPPGDWALDFVCSGAFVFDLQRGINGGSFRDVYFDASTKVTINSASGPCHAVVAGGGDYRMDVSTYSSEITMIATRCK